MSLSLIKILKESDSFSPNYIHQYNKVLEDTTGQPLYGNQALFDYVTKPSGSYIGYMYYVGDTGNAVRYSTQGGNIVTVDVFYNYSSKPTYSVQMDYDNPEETIEAVSDIIISPSHSFQNEFITEATKVTKKTIKKPNYGGFDINQFVKPIDNKEKSSIYKWIKSTAINFRDEAVLTVLSQKDYVNAFRLYVNWCKSNAVAIKGMKQYGSYGGFYLKLKEAYELSNVSTLMKKSKSLVMQAESEEIQVNNTDAQYFEDLEKKYKLTPNQTFDNLKRGMKSILMGVDNSLIVAGDPGIGKAMPLDEPILTPNGWVKMGDLKIGDEVISQNGKATKVLNIFPQEEERDCYKVSFTDDTWTRCDGEHLWTVIDDNGYGKKRKWKTLTTNYIKENLIKNLKNRKRFKWRIPIVNPVEHEEKKFIIEPYVLGVLLGDGSFRSSKRPEITSADQQIFDEVKKLLPDGIIFECLKSTINNGNKACKYAINSKNRYDNIITEEIKYLGLANHYSYEKFIPESYKFSSIEQRIELLRGLMDTDGTIQKSGNLSYCTTSNKLANDVVCIVQSLGGTAKIGIKHPTYKYKGELKNSRIAYIINIILPNDINPFKLERKANKFIEKIYKPIRKINSIELCGKEKMQCILVEDESHTYITRNYIVTHNTYGVTKTLTGAGLQKKEMNIANLEMIANAVLNGDTELLKSLRDSMKGSYVYVSGGTTPYGVYSTMYMANGGIIVFDDCDEGIFNDPLGINIIKATTDDKKTRTVSYVTKNTMRKASLIPPQFDFNGRVIFITNLSMSKIPSAIASRANIVNFDFTFDEGMKVITKVLPILCKDIPGANLKVKQEVFKYLMEVGKQFNKIDFRTFQQSVKIRILGIPNWRKAVGKLVLEKQKTY